MLWLEGLRWNLKNNLPLEAAGDQELQETEEPRRAKASIAWEFDQVGVYVLRGPETDDADEKPRESKYYDDLAKYGEVLWREWPKDGFRDERRKYRDVLWDVNDNDRRFYDDRPDQYTSFIRSIWMGDGWDYEKNDIL